MWPHVHILVRQESLLDERQQRRVIADGVRHVMRLGEWRHRDERHPEAELIEVGTARRIGARLSGTGRPTSDSEAWTDGGRIRLATSTRTTKRSVHRTLRTAAGLLAGRRVREILALTGVDAVGIQGAPLRSWSRGNVIIEAAVLVVRDEEDRVLPVRAVP